MFEFCFATLKYQKYSYCLEYTCHEHKSVISKPELSMNGDPII